MLARRSPFDFSLDLATQLDFVSRHSNCSALRPVGIDHGGTAFFMMNAFQHPRYQAMVASCYFYAPIGFLGRLRSLPFATLADLRDVLLVRGEVLVRALVRVAKVHTAYLKAAVRQAASLPCGAPASRTADVLELKIT